MTYAPSELFGVNGLVAVITGGGTGIGLIMATALESNGAIVYILGRRQHVLDDAASRNSKFGNLIPIQCDVTNRNSLLSAVETIKARHGYIDLLVNNAGIARNLYSHPLPTPPPSRLGSPVCGSTSVASEIDPSSFSIRTFQASLWNAGSPEDFAQVFETNVTSVYYTTVAFLDLLHHGNLRQQAQEMFPSIRPPYHSSQVLSVSSSGAFRIDPKILSMSYTLSKAACTHLGRVMANMLVPWGIRSNVIAPGVWPSEMTTSLVHDLSSRLDPSVLARDVPLKRTGTVDDMAGAILFLASRAGAYMNGSVFVTDGGRANAYLGGGAASAC